MTLKEALIEVRHFCRGNAEALKMAEKALEKADEYRWHRELNSFDLPKEDEEIFVHMRYKSTDSYVYGMACEFDWSEDGGIVAWKYPELDDEVEE